MSLAVLLRRVALPALAFALLLAAPLSAQQANGERVLRSWTDEVKTDDGKDATWTFTITFDLETGDYIRTVLDEDGALVERTVTNESLVGPTEEELRMAETMIMNDAELRALYDAAVNPTLSGGFVLRQEDGDCGPGSRCLQFDLYDVNEAERQVERIRFIVVDVREDRIVSRDFDPRYGNPTRFNR